MGVPSERPRLLSAIICSWNPRPAYISRTIAALGKQTLALAEWEMIVVDNNSSPPISEMDVKLPPNGRFVRELQPGLTWARLRGIAEASAPIAVFVDDDNVLDADYLAEALAVAERFPSLGVWGGRILAEFEVEPPAWMAPFWENLALHDFSGERWTNQRDFSCFPCGAGMCLRRSVALTYAAQVKSDRQRRSFDRTGTSLVSCGDTDIVLTALASGVGVGKFSSLTMKHLIPKERMTVEYHCRLASGIGVSIGQINGRSAARYPVTLRSTARGLLEILRSRGPARRIRWTAFLAYRRGLREGWRAREGSGDS